MLTHPTLDLLNQLGLNGMAKAFGEIETSDEATVHSSGCCTRSGGLTKKPRTKRGQLIVRFAGNARKCPRGYAIAGFQRRLRLKSGALSVRRGGLPSLLMLADERRIKASLCPDRIQTILQIASAIRAVSQAP